MTTATIVSKVKLETFSFYEPVYARIASASPCACAAPIRREVERLAQLGPGEPAADKYCYPAKHSQKYVDPAGRVFAGGWGCRSIRRRRGGGREKGGSVGAGEIGRWERGGSVGGKVGGRKEVA